MMTDKVFMVDSEEMQAGGGKVVEGFGFFVTPNPNSSVLPQMKPPLTLRDTVQMLKYSL